MIDLLGSIAIWNIFVILLVILIRATNISKVNWGWLAFALVLFSTYVFLNKFDVISLIGVELTPSTNRLNIDGKIIGCLIAMVMISLSIVLTNHKISLNTIGLRIQQIPNSAKPAIALTIALCVFTLALEFVKGSRSIDTTTVSLLIYPIIAGLDEELMYRGFLLAVFCLALPRRFFTILGANISLGGIIALVLFALIHGFKIKNGIPALSASGIGLTLLYGSAFLWLREKTGSLVFPVLAHNAVNYIALLF